MKIISTSTFKVTNEVFETNTKPSETVPDMSYTINQILQKFTSGQSLNISQHIDYDDDDVSLDNYIPETGVDTLTEIQDNKERVNQINQLVNEQKEQIKQKKVLASEELAKKENELKSKS